MKDRELLDRRTRADAAGPIHRNFATTHPSSVLTFTPASGTPRRGQGDFYNTLSQLVNNHKHSQIVYLLCGFNARVQTQFSPGESCIGNCTFGKHNVTIDQQQDNTLGACNTSQPSARNTPLS